MAYRNKISKKVFTRNKQKDETCQETDLELTDGNLENICENHASIQDFISKSSFENVDKNPMISIVVFHQE